MLVLSRRVDEGIVFTGPGLVVVLGIRGRKVKLGFEVEPGVDVDRDEVAEAIRRDGARRHAKP